jgi:hypothetical protein
MEDQDWATCEKKEEPPRIMTERYNADFAVMVDSVIVVEGECDQRVTAKYSFKRGRELAQEGK